MITGRYPSLRLRRNRKNDWSRRLVQENNLSSNDLIWPIFITDGKNVKEPIKSMPGVYRYSLDKLESLVEKAIYKKIPMIALEMNSMSDFVSFRQHASTRRICFFYVIFYVIFLSSYYFLLGENIILMF